MREDFKRLALDDRGTQSLAYQHIAPAAHAAGKPGILFLSGFFSDMLGTKASFLAERCAAMGRGFTRFDYRGHGESSGQFSELCLSDWLQDVLAILDRVVSTPQILVGSSMGGWLMLLAALQRPQKIVQLLGIAAAPDFTEDLIWARLSPAQQEKMQKDGFLLEPSNYQAPPLKLTHKLIVDGRQHLLLRAPIALKLPLRLMQGQQDPDVPWQLALQLAEKIEGSNVSITLIKDGDHRLSRPQDLEMLAQLLELN